jgi:hypothetical protein
LEPAKAILLLGPRSRDLPEATIFGNGRVFVQPLATLLIEAPVAFFELRQEGRALFRGASLAHDAMAGEGGLLGRRRLSAVIGDEFGRGERAEMMQVGVQRANQRWASVDDSDTCVTPAVDAPRVAFGLAKPAFQVQIVAWQLIDWAQKQSRQKAGHQSGQVLSERVRLLGESLLELLERTATVLLRASIRIERVGHGLDRLHLRPQLVLSLLDRLQPPVNAGR